MTHTLKIISGGQTGADRGALEAAIALGMPHGGWCPRGRRAEDGQIPQQFQMSEHSSSAYPTRTRLNLMLADATLIVANEPFSGGSLLTLNLCAKLKRTHLPITAQALRRDFDSIVNQVCAWLDYVQPQVLNVAGSRESSFPGIQRDVKELILRSCYGR